jgi:hypothetical protein
MEFTGAWRIQTGGVISDVSAHTTPSKDDANCTPMPFCNAISVLANLVLQLVAIPTSDDAGAALWSSFDGKYMRLLTSNEAEPADISSLSDPILELHFPAGCFYF